MKRYYLNKIVPKLVLLPLIFVAGAGLKRPVPQTDKPSYFTRIEVPPLSRDYFVEFNVFAQLKVYDLLYKPYVRVGHHNGEKIVWHFRLAHDYGWTKTSTDNYYRKVYFFPDFWDYKGGDLDIIFKIDYGDDVPKLNQTITIRAHELTKKYVYTPSGVCDYYTTPDAIETLYLHPNKKMTKKFALSFEHFDSVIYNDYYGYIDLSMLKIIYGGLNIDYLNHNAGSNPNVMNAYLYLPSCDGWFDGLGPKQSDGRIRFTLRVNHDPRANSKDKDITFDTVDAALDKKTGKPIVYRGANTCLTTLIVMPLDKYDELNDLPVTIEVTNIGEACVDVILNTKIHFRRNYVGKAYDSEFTIISEQSKSTISEENPGKKLQ